MRTHRQLGFAVLAAALVGCAVGDNSTPPKTWGYGPSGPADDPNDDDHEHAHDESTGDSSGDGEASEGGGAGESGEGSFPMPEPGDGSEGGAPGDEGGQPPPPPPPPQAGDCCTATMTPGCANDPAVEMCVCGSDDFCCTTEWDAQCVSLVSLCAEACPGAPPPDQGDSGGGMGGACCAPTGGPGCGDPFAEVCVCSIDDYCCFVDWDDVCVQIATEECMIC